MRPANYEPFSYENRRTDTANGIRKVLLFSENTFTIRVHTRPCSRATVKEKKTFIRFVAFKRRPDFGFPNVPLVSLMKRETLRRPPVRGRTRPGGGARSGPTTITVYGEQISRRCSGFFLSPLPPRNERRNSTVVSSKVRNSFAGEEKTIQPTRNGRV